MKKILLLAAFFAGVLGAPLWGASKWEVIPSVHTWGGELDVGWRPVSLIPGRQTTFWVGGAGILQFWSYFHDPVTGQAVLSPNSTDASVTQLLGQWFAGATQGLVAHFADKGYGGQPWATPDLIELYGLYRGTVWGTLASGSYLANSSQPDKNGYVQTAFLGGVDLNMLTKTNTHNLRQGFMAEAAWATAPRGIQSVDVDYNRFTGTLKGFFPLYDSDPLRKNNQFSVEGGLALAWDHLWGHQIPSEELQLIGGRALGGFTGWVQGVGGQVRGPNPGTFDGTDKFIGNVELRFNLPGFDLPWFAQDYFGLPTKSLFEGQVIPGFITFYDYGYWNGLSGYTDGYVNSEGLGVFCKFWDLGTVAAYVERWQAYWGNIGQNGIGTPFESQSFAYTLSLGLQF